MQNSIQTRFRNKSEIGPFIKKILSLEIFNLQNSDFDDLPLTFFNHDHYLRTWEPVFLFETSCCLLKERFEKTDRWYSNLNKIQDDKNFIMVKIKDHDLKEHDLVYLSQEKESIKIDKNSILGYVINKDNKN